MQGIWSEGIAIFVSFVLCTPGAAIVWNLFFRKKPAQFVETLEEKTERIMTEVSDHLLAIQTLAYEVNDSDLRLLVFRTCADTTLLLEKVAEKKPLSKANAGIIIGTYLSLLRDDILPQYIDMQKNPDIFQNVEESFAQAHKSIGNFDKYLRGSILLLEKDEITRFQVALRLLDPLEFALL